MTTQAVDDTAGALTFPLDSPVVGVPEHERSAILADPGYGRYFTDHMAAATWTDDRGWHDDRLTAFGPLSMSPAASVLHYGQAVFEGLKAYRHADGSVWSFRPEENALRFQRSARRIALPELPAAAFLRAVDRVVTADRQWVPDQPESSLYLRPVMFANEAHLGNRPARTVDFRVIASPASSYFVQGAKPVEVWVSTDYPRATPGGTGEAKFGGNYAGSIVANLDAAAHGCEHVLFLDAVERRWVEELGAMNVFAVYDDGTIVTPPLSGTILPGITRGAVLTLAAELGHRMTEAPIDIEDLLTDARSGHLTELFACGTAAVVTTIGKLVTREGSVTLTEGTELGPVTRTVRTRLLDIQYGRSEDEHGWLHRWL